MEMAKFENRFLTTIQGFTQSKIEKAKVLSRKLNHCIEKAYCQCNWQRI